MRLFRHGSSVGQKEQARRGDVTPSDQFLRRARHIRRLWAAAMIGTAMAAGNCMALFFQEPLGRGFWLSLFAAVLCAGCGGFYAERAWRMS